jgi:hypothetical protein
MQKCKWRCKLCLIKREVAKKTGKWTSESNEDDDFSNLHRNPSIKKLMNNFPIEKNDSEQQAEIMTEKEIQHTKSNEIENRFFLPIECKLFYNLIDKICYLNRI